MREFSDKLLVAYPDNEKILKQYFQFIAQHRNYPDAWEILEKYLQKTPNNKALENAVLNYLKRQSASIETAHQWKQLFQLAKSSPSSLYHYSLYLAKNENTHKKADALWHEYRQKKQQNQEADLFYAWYLSDSGRTDDQANAILKGFVENYPDNFSFVRAYSYFLAENREDKVTARALWKVYGEHFSDVINQINLSYLMLKHDGDNPETLTFLKQLSDSRPTDFQVRIPYIQSLLLQGKLEQAKSMLSKSFEEAQKYSFITPRLPGISLLP